LLGHARGVRVDRQLEAAARRGLAERAGRADRASEGVDRDAVPLEAAVQPAVVGRLDARLPDDLARLHVRVLVGLELVLRDLAVQPEELRAEGTLRVLARGERDDVQARERTRALVEELREHPREV